MPSDASTRCLELTSQHSPGLPPRLRQQYESISTCRRQASQYRRPRSLQAKADIELPRPQLTWLNKPPKSTMSHDQHRRQEGQGGRPLLRLPLRYEPIQAGSLDRHLEAKHRRLPLLRQPLSAGV